MVGPDELLRIPDTVAVPRLASTVALIRDGDAGIETWMMRRVQGMAFAAGAMVFPGGRIDEADFDQALKWSAVSPEMFASQLRTDAETARALATAAVRELFEETGALLADPMPTVDLEKARVKVERREMTLGALVGDGSGALQADALHPWARWITPPVEPRRFDTYFFVATLPDGTDASAISGEADHADWFLARDVLDSQARGESLVLPPTRALLEDLVEADSVDQVIRLAPERSLDPVNPEIRQNDDGSIDVVAGRRVYQVVAASD